MLPIVVYEYLKASLLATRKKVSCLPHLLLFQRAHSEVTLTLTNLPVCFKDVLNQESLIEAKGNKIVHCLLTAAKELGEKQLIVRRIQSSKVMFSSDFDQVMF